MLRHYPALIKFQLLITCLDDVLACFNLAAKFFVVNLLNSWIVMSLAWSGILFSTWLIFVLRTALVTKQLVSGIFFSTWQIFY